MWPVKDLQIWYLDIAPYEFMWFLSKEKRERSLSSDIGLFSRGASLMIVDVFLLDFI